MIILSLTEFLFLWKLGTTLSERKLVLSGHVIGSPQYTCMYGYIPPDTARTFDGSLHQF